MFIRKFKEEFIGLFILAMIGLFVMGYRTISGQFNPIEVRGFLIGIGIGQVGIYLHVVSNILGKHKSLAQTYTIFTFFIAVFISAFISKYLGLGYFIGYCTIYMLGFSLFELIKKCYKNKSNKKN